MLAVKIFSPKRGAYSSGVFKEEYSYGHTFDREEVCIEKNKVPRG